MKRLTLFLILVLSLPLAAHADDASRHAKAKEMLVLMHMDRLMAQMMDNALQQINALSKQLGGNNISPENQAKVNNFQQKIVKVITDQMSWSAMEPAYIDLYAKNFSDEELDGIIAFYKSPAGVSMVEKLPSLTTQGTEIAQQRMAAIQPQLRQMVEDFAKSEAPASEPSAPKSSTPK